MHEETPCIWRTWPWLQTSVAVQSKSLTLVQGETSAQLWSLRLKVLRLSARWLPSRPGRNRRPKVSPPCACHTWQHRPYTCYLLLDSRSRRSQVCECLWCAVSEKQQSKPALASQPREAAAAGPKPHALGRKKRPQEVSRRLLSSAGSATLVGRQEFGSFARCTNYLC